MLTIVSYCWGDKWGPEYPARLAAGLARQIKQPYRFVAITDNVAPKGATFETWEIPAEDRHLLKVSGCFARMRLFDGTFQAAHGIGPGERVACVDLDVVPTDSLDHLFDRDDEFNIMQGFNGTNPCPFNGSLWMLRGGERHDVWDDFSLEAYRTRGVPFHAFPDDQGWLHSKFPNARAYTPKDGVYAMKKNGWGSAGRRGLPQGACLVAFPGRDPAKYSDVGWVQRHWVGV